MSSNFRAPPVFQSDEIDLVALFQAVWQQKKLIMLATAGVGLISAAYAFLATPEYQASSVLRPAAINELDALNRSDVYQLPPSEALIKVGASLESYETRLGFFRANQKLFQAYERRGQTLEQGFEEFNRNSISLALPDSKSAVGLSSYIKVELNYPEGVDGVAIVNGLVDYAINIERKQIAADMVVIVSNRLNELEGKYDSARSSYDSEKETRIAKLQEADVLRHAQLLDELKALRAQLKSQRLNRLAQLSEAIGIAKALNIRKPSTPSSFSDTERTTAPSVMRTEVNNQQIPLYFMGVEVLEAERAALQARKSDDFTEGRISQIAKELQLLEANREIEVLNARKNEEVFLGGVESLRAEMVRLRNLSTNMNSLKLATIDQEASEPLSSIKPKRTLLIVLGLLIGAVLGLVIAAFRYFMSPSGSALGSNSTPRVQGRETTVELPKI